MRKRHRAKQATVLVLLAVLVSLAIILGGCSGAGRPQKKVSLYIYAPYFGDSNKLAAFKPAYDKWIEDHKNSINIESVLVSGDDVRTKIKVDVASNKTPAVFGYGGFEAGYCQSLWAKT